MEMTSEEDERFEILSLHTAIEAFPGEIFRRVSPVSEVWGLKLLLGARSPLYVWYLYISGVAVQMVSFGQQNLEPFHVPSLIFDITDTPEKYVNWPDGATSRDSLKAVLKLPRLQNLIMQHVDHSVGELINMVQGNMHFNGHQRLQSYLSNRNMERDERG
ncbi:unnamed protein product [Eruca vesicaria subsp. sativa]|uniref:Uncharacterized protein n=1 Tax=Eruca vesicaria subsp. sativa TaxID=29727 RepID=A0ABC8KZ96_ERUVS|nr:unnamed protein product [Eruca vesicaria subsp. sativa]